MALFKITAQDSTQMSSWLKSVRQELKSNLHTKSSLYDFDFTQDLPSNKSSRFEWDFDSEFYYEERELSTQPSISRHTEDLIEMFSNLGTFVNIPDLELGNSLL